MGWFTKLRDAVESAAVVAGNYYLPGSSMVTSRLVSKGSQDQLNSDLGRVAQIGSGLAGAGVGSEYTGIPASGGYNTLSEMFGGGGAGSGVPGAAPPTSTLGEGIDMGTSNAAAGYDTTGMSAGGAGTAPPAFSPTTVAQGSNLPSYGTAGGEGNYGYDMGTGTAVTGTQATAPVYGGSADKAALFGAEGYGPAASPAELGNTGSSPGFLNSLMSGNFGDAAGAAGDWAMKNPIPAIYGAGSLYDMYAKNQMANRQNALYDQNRRDILNTYLPGSPEYNLLKQEMDRKDAAAGRNSQYATRANEFAGKIAGIRMNALGNMQSGQNALANTAMGNQYGMFNTPLTLAALTATSKGR
jgi:hypothetical protein